MIEQTINPTSGTMMPLHKEINAEAARQLLLSLSPHLWPTGEEIDFGDGSYGRRFVGHVEVAALTRGTLQLMDAPLFVNIINSGGWYHPGTVAKGNVLCAHINAMNNTTTPTFFYISSVHIDAVGRVVFASISSNARVGTTNNAYDIWIRYTK
jgi:hypothetical protein